MSVFESASVSFATHKVAEHMPDHHLPNFIGFRQFMYQFQCVVEFTIQLPVTTVSQFAAGIDRPGVSFAQNLIPAISTEVVPRFKGIPQRIHLPVNTPAFRLLGFLQPFSSVFVWSSGMEASTVMGMLGMTPPSSRSCTHLPRRMGSVLIVQ
jgi:hypothetical protein